MEKTLVLAGNHEQFRHWCRRHKISHHNPMVIYIDRSEQILGHASVKVVRTGEWWLNPLHNDPRLRIVEKTWNEQHPSLDCGHRSEQLIYPNDLGAEPYCPQCTINMQTRLIGDLAQRLKAFSTILAGEQAKRAALIIEVEAFLETIRLRFGDSEIADDPWEQLTAKLRMHLP